MTEIVIRRAIPKDAPEIAALHIRSWQWTYRGQIPDAYLDGLPRTIDHRTAQWQEALGNGAREECEWVADREGILIGFASAGPGRDGLPASTGEVYAIYVDPDVAGTGVGWLLFTRTVEELRERGYDVATLWVLESNQRARRFYERAGWSADGATKVEQREGFVLREVRYRMPLVEASQ